MAEQKDLNKSSEHIEGTRNVTVDEVIVGYHTPLYLVLSALAVVMAIGLWLPWATVPTPESAAEQTNATIVKGIEVGISPTLIAIAALAIALLGVIGYFWNPWSDPEALFILFFSLSALSHGIVKARNPQRIVDPLNEFEVTNAQVGSGLYLTLICALICGLGAIWILATRPSPKYD